MEKIAVKILAKDYNFLTANGLMKKAKKAGVSLCEESTKRQVATAIEIFRRLYKRDDHRNVLLADDVGTGKTTVAALLALIVARKGGRVHVIAPNEIMQGKWHQELMKYHRVLYGIESKKIFKSRKRVLSGDILVGTYTHASRTFRQYDLLVIDEAHRSRGCQKLLKSHRSNLDSKTNTGVVCSRVVCLTATPFSISATKLVSLLTNIRAKDCTSVARFAGRLSDLYVSRSEEERKRILSELKDSLWEPAMATLQQYVIRHSVDSLPVKERSLYGTLNPNSDDTECNIKAEPEELEILLMADRLMSLAKQLGARDKKTTNDPRNHVSWKFLESEIKKTQKHLEASRLKSSVSGAEQSEILLTLFENLSKDLLGRISKCGPHPKIGKIIKVIKQINHDEKILIFCYHHATAQDVSKSLLTAFEKQQPISIGSTKRFQQAWDGIIDKNQKSTNPAYKASFIDWLGQPSVINGMLIRDPALKSAMGKSTSLLIQHLNHKQAQLN